MTKTNRLAPGGTGENSAWLGQRTKETEKRYAKPKPNAIPGGSAMPLDRAKGVGNSRAGLTYGAGHAESGTIDETSGKILAAGSGTSIFDPVLCEIAYLWFCPPGGLVLDPFAGGSVRGIVASKLGRQYIGVELRAEQVAANRAQANEICADAKFPPAWVHGDSRNIHASCREVDADMVFSCPPYADLERYSDDPADISTMDYPAFREAYFDIINQSCARLKPDSFACFVVGEVRDKRGNYVDFVGDTVQAFRDAGLEYYNEAILITMVGSLPIRVGSQFSGGRKLGKTHQNVLVFVKGTGKGATKRCGPVEIDESLFDSVVAADGGLPGGLGDFGIAA